MDLRLFASVIWRFKWVALVGLVAASVLAALSVVRVDHDGIHYRQSEKWASYARIFVTEQGFPWGRLQASGTVDPGRFAGLAVLYANLADSDPVKRLVQQQEPRIRGTYEASALFTPTNDALPIISVAGIAETKRDSLRLTDQVSDALLSFIREQQAQNAIPEKDRVVVELVQRAGRPTRLSARPLTVPIVIFVACLALTVAFIFVLQNLFRPAQVDARSVPRDGEPQPLRREDLVRPVRDTGEPVPDSRKGAL